ncbi:restriction endonuclease subunit S [Capnocytophaga ochracea]|uniref:EcoKI restriction-modification system protein HsdS n=1 Tax=Capnocytophaga ochracea TaxID=1018 RepID=A0A2X2SXB4_CAPOC|nr:restriction endonuclease subunit S [Capnocytophaga ochracea]SQA92833.1 EcoKI restriction-modification system protein HsdS [Capnocytophaga ochracea]
MESTKPKGENFTYIDLDAVNNKKNNIDNPKILKSINAPSRASRKLHTNDVLYSMVRPYLRNIALVDKKFSNAIASTGFYVITPSIALHPHFLFHLMLSSYVTDGLNLFMKGENSPSINNSHIEDFLYPLPPLAEQQRIVEKIEGLIPHIEHYGKAQTELDLLNRSIKEQLKKSVLQYAIEGELVPQDETEGTAEVLLEQIQKEKLKLYEENKLKKKDLEHSTIFKDEDNKYYEKIGKNVTCIDEEIPFDIPKNWRWVRFGQIVKLSMGKTPPRDDSRYWLNAKRNWVSISDMTNYGRIKTTKEQISEEAANSLMRESSPINTLLMSFKLTVGRTAILDIEAYHNEAIVSIYPYIDKKFMLRNYLFYTLPILANIGDSKDAIKGKTLNSKSLNNLLIPLPPLAEQLRIIESIDTIFRCIEKD